AAHCRGAHDCCICQRKRHQLFASRLRVCHWRQVPRSNEHGGQRDGQRQEPCGAHSYRLVRGERVGAATTILVSDYTPIADYALISDCHSAALVSRHGSVDWCCFDRFDAGPVFGRLLDWCRGGHFTIDVKDPHHSTRRYLPGTNVLETTFQTKTGRLVLTDCLAIREGSDADGAEEVAPYRQLLRLARCESGEVTVQCEFVPRFDYGLTTPQLTRLGADLATVYGGSDALLVQSDLMGEQIGLAGF